MLCQPTFTGLASTHLAFATAFATLLALTTVLIAAAFAFSPTGLLLPLLAGLLTTLWGATELLLSLALAQFIKRPIRKITLALDHLLQFLHGLLARALALLALCGLQVLEHTAEFRKHLARFVTQSALGLLLHAIQHLFEVLLA